VSDLAPILQGFFTDRLARQKKASPNTVAAYRDTCKLLLAFAQQKAGKPPSRLSLADLNAALIGEFLQHLEDKRGNGSATRNARLATIHSLFRYAALRAPVLCVRLREPVPDRNTQPPDGVSDQSGG
jgi:integrase/recombinase XerD